LKEFAPYRRTLNYVVVFQPHYAVFHMDAKRRETNSNLCLDDSGEYCAEDPDGAGPVTGKMVLLEDVRQHCIHKTNKVKRVSEYSEKAGMKEGIDYNEKYWKYVEKFLDTCPLDGSGDKGFGEACSVKLMHELNIDIDRVNACMSAETVSFLQEQRKHPAWSPRAMRINGWRYSGIMDPDLVTRAICSGFINRPAECTTLLNYRDPTNIKRYIVQEGISWLQVLWVVLILLVVSAIPLFLYKRYLKKEMRMSLREEVMLEVQAQMGEYRKMQGGN